MDEQVQWLKQLSEADGVSGFEGEVKELLKEKNTNFDSLIKNIENNNDLRNLIKKIILDGYEISYNEDNFIITMAIMYGVFKNSNGKVKIHNRIYEQRIYNYMSSLIAPI